MAKRGGAATKGKRTTRSESVYKVVEVIGASTVSWEEAATNALKTASRSLRDLRVAEVVKQDIAVKGDKEIQFRVRMLLSFKYDAP